MNQLVALSLAAGCQAKEIVAYVKGVLLGEKNNVVFLYEIPFYEGANGRLCGIRQIHDDILAEFQMYQVFRAEERKAYFCTWAIANEESGWERVVGEDRFQVYANDEEREAIQQNRFMELTHSSGLRVLGVHAPLDNTFFDALLEYTPKAKALSPKFVVIGDLNCHGGERSSHKEYLERMESEERLCNLVSDDAETYFPAHTTIDYALASPALKEKATAKVYSKEELYLSDHTVIVVDVSM